MKSPIIKLYILNITDKKLNTTDKISFLSIKRAREYFDMLNKFNNYEVYLETSVLRFW